jgi:GH15 family glucan-1,4-alpha-glucosidase
MFGSVCGTTYESEIPGMRIEDYAILGDTQTIALVGRDTSIDWLCFPRFDSAACFAGLLGTKDNGGWKLTPRGEVRATRRSYRADTCVLETELDTDDGTVRVIDFMPIRGHAPDIVRIVEGVRGRVEMCMELIVRFAYGRVVPWVRKIDGRLHAIAGPDALVLATPVPLKGENMTTVGSFTVERGTRVPFVLTWHASYTEVPESPDPFTCLADTEDWWREWVGKARVHGPHRDAVMRSLITLKALTYSPSGGIVAAGTTSLPEQLGGVRNWDYRFCWLRDATFTLQAMLHAGYRDEAIAWRDWLVRAVAGDPSKLQIMYGVTGERELYERDLDWLPGYQCSRPVRVGNRAVGQRQLDVYGELLDALFESRASGLDPEPYTWAIECACLDWLEEHWAEPDEGIWEIRGEPLEFTFSKVMVWAAFDRAVKTVERFGADGPVGQWRAVRDRVHADVCKHGFDRERNTFTLAYDSKLLDASLLLIPVVGFLPADDPRTLGTLAAIERELCEDGLVRRYETRPRGNFDGLPGREGVFLACSFWLVDALALAGRLDDARALFEQLLALRNDVGLLAEEYDPVGRQQLGNFPQAFSHVALVNSARNLHDVASGPAQRRGQ